MAELKRLKGVRNKLRGTIRGAGIDIDENSTDDEIVNKAADALEALVAHIAGEYIDKLDPFNPQEQKRLFRRAANLGRAGRVAGAAFQQEKTQFGRRAEPDRFLRRPQMLALALATLAPVEQLAERFRQLGRIANDALVVGNAREERIHILDAPAARRRREASDHLLHARRAVS